jgi:ATP adenylyltransferase
MDQLWAPWRLAYVVKDAPPVTDECFICRGLAASEDRKNLIVLRVDGTVVLLNRYPYNNGHLLIGPLRHVGRLDELTSNELLEINETLRHMVAILEKLIKPDGFNIGVNLGRVAGAGLPGHIHWHIVPRWNGDTNFMPILTDTKVIVQSLDAFYDMLSPELRDLKQGSRS